MAEIIDGKHVSSVIRTKVAEEIVAFKAEHGVTPGLAVIIVGENPASMVYVRNKKRACEQVGINSYEIAMSADISEEELARRKAAWVLPERPEEKGLLGRYARMVGTAREGATFR